MNKSLFSISAEMQQITNELIENGGELTPELETALAITEPQLKSKGVAYSVVIRSLEYDNVIIDAEIKRLQSLKKTRSNTVDRLKSTLSNAMIFCGIEEIETATVKINFRKSQSLSITDELKIPKKFKVRTVVTSIDKNEIKKSIKNGDSVKGAELITNKNLQIK